MVHVLSIGLLNFGSVFLLLCYGWCFLEGVG